jgi:hypothetical protein
MPLCHCQSYGCGSTGGVQLSSMRTFRNHCQADKLRQASQATNNAIEDQLDLIASHLASTTLSDDNTALPSSSGGRLWSNSSSYSPDSTPDPPDITASNSPSRRELLCSLLLRLNEIEEEVKSLDKRVDAQLPSLADSTSSATFPLKPLFIQCQNIQLDLEKIKSKAPSVDKMRTSVIEQLQNVRKKIDSAKRAWSSNQKASNIPSAKSDIHYETGLHKISIEYVTILTFLLDHLFKPILPSTEPIIQLSIFLVIGCKVILGTSRRGCSFILQILQYLIQLCLMRNSELLSQRDKKMLSDFPVDPRTPEKHLNIEPKGEILAVCPNDSCQAVYSPTFNGASPIPIYQTYCSNNRYGRRCRQILLRPKQVQGKLISLPIKLFVYFTPKEHIADFVSQPNLEAKMDGAWCRESTSKDDDVRDVFEAEMLRDFKGPDGHLFSRCGDDGKEGRYVFSLCVDFFNPLSNKQAGKKSSVGIISLVCLNLPPDIRYKPQNTILVGIIPGP